MNWQQPFSINADRVSDRLTTLVDRNVREPRQDERRLAKNRWKKHQPKARKSYAANDQCYRVTSHQFKRWLIQPPLRTRLQDTKRSDYNVRSTPDRIEVGPAKAHHLHMVAKLRWQTITKPSVVLLHRVASQTTMAFSRSYSSLGAFLKGKRPMPPRLTPTILTYVYEIRARADKSGVDVISDALPFGPLWYTGPNAVSSAIDFAKFFSRSQHHAVILVYDEDGNVIEAQHARGRVQRAASAVMLRLSRRAKNRDKLIPK
jgi:hypothetical protein